MKRIYFLLVAAFVSAVTMAQTGNAPDVNVDINGPGNSGGFPWLWVVGAIVFIVLLVALLGGRGGTDRVVEKRTVIKE